VKNETFRFGDWSTMRRHRVHTPEGLFTVGETWDSALARIETTTERMGLVKLDEDRWVETRLFSNGRLVEFEIAREDTGPYRIVRMQIRRE
jgi:hypothetical protein